MKKSWKIILCILGVAVCLYGSVSAETAAAKTDGWAYEKDAWYYYENGDRKVLSWIYSSSADAWYYVDEEGKMVHGWGTGYAENCFFNEDGTMATEWKYLVSKEEAAAYNLFPDSSTNPSEEALFEEYAGWYYFGSNGVMSIGWTKVGDDWCYFGTGTADSLDVGVMAVGLVKIDDGFYYFSDEGRMRTGLIKLSDGYYYFGITGKMQTSKTIYQVKGKWTTTKPTTKGKYNTYVLDADGRGVSGSIIIE